jgi:uncharacterized protein (TIGR02611 family)
MDQSFVCETGRLESESRSDRRGESSAGKSSQRRVVDAARRWFVAVRSFVHGWPGGHHAWRVGIGVLGLVVVIAGIVMLVLPGPGWVVIFVGFGIWATEFPWAHSVLAFVRRLAASWTDWIGNRPHWLWVSVGIVCLLFVGAVAWVALM